MKLHTRPHNSFSWPQVIQWLENQLWVITNTCSVDSLDWQQKHETTKRQLAGLQIPRLSRLPGHFLSNFTKQRLPGDVVWHIRGVGAAWSCAACEGLSQKRPSCSPTYCRVLLPGCSALPWERTDASQEISILICVWYVWPLLPQRSPVKLSLSSFTGRKRWN